MSYDAVRLIHCRSPGNPEFIAGLERVLGRPIARRAPGRKRKAAVEDEPRLL
jgi:hypothetical protein